MLRAADNTREPDTADEWRQHRRYVIGKARRLHIGRLHREKADDFK